MQLEFVEIENIDTMYYVAIQCENCENKCKIYCISKDAEVICKKYKKIK